MKKYLSRAYLILIFGILYIPIITLIFFSFSERPDGTAHSEKGEHTDKYEYFLEISHIFLLFYTENIFLSTL